MLTGIWSNTEELADVPVVGNPGGQAEAQAVGAAPFPVANHGPHDPFGEVETNPFHNGTSHARHVAEVGLTSVVC